MKRVLPLAAALFVCLTIQAQQKDPYAHIRAYTSRVLPKCPNGTLTIEPLQTAPQNFVAFQATLRSSDQYCGAQKFVLVSPATQQVLIGSVLQLPADKRPANVRVAEEASKVLKKAVTATVAPFPLPDGLKSVSITRVTPYGAFTYQGYVDASEQYLIVGSRGSLKTDPAQSLRQALGVSSAARRGNKTAKVEILEISDFQCPTCAHAHEKVEPLIKQGLSKINYVRIDLPLFEHHEWSIPAAAAARAILRVAPAKYWAYVDYVFKNQEVIGKQPFDKVIEEYCQDNDIDWAAVKAIYASKAERQALLDQVSKAFSVGIASTPTFIVNGQVLGFGPEGTFTIEAIKSAIGSASAAPAKKSGK